MCECQLFAGGLRHASASVSGPNSYKRMKFEAGVHRVQRVPKTEKQGRIHTSTMTVAVLPQPTEVRPSLRYLALVLLQAFKKVKINQ